MKDISLRSIRKVKPLNLNVFREAIDAIDNELMDILIRRMELSKQIAQYKNENNLPTRDRKRELEMIEKRTGSIDDPVVKEALSDVLEAILKASRDVQDNSK